MKDAFASYVPHVSPTPLTGGQGQLASERIAADIVAYTHAGLVNVCLRQTVKTLIREATIPVSGVIPSKCMPNATALATT